MDGKAVTAIGLTQAEADRLYAQGYGNRSSSKAGLSRGQIVLRHCLTYFNFVFLALAAVLALTGSSIKNMTFLVIVVINTAIGIFQQLRAKQAVEKLTLIAQRQVPTLRDGVFTGVPGDKLVLGDVVSFGAGDQICADCQVLSGRLFANEALLTGEADGVEKLPGDGLLSGSFVLSGSAVARLTGVGDNAFAARLVQEAKKDPRAAKSEMMDALDRLIRWVGVALIPVGILLFCQEYYLLQLGLQKSAQATVAALVGMIPEGLYLLTSVAMAVSAIQLTKKQVLVQDMNCIEALARVDVLCVDKTGTITQPEMELAQLLPAPGVERSRIEQLLQQLYAASEPENDTARALQRRFPAGAAWPCRKHIPFDSRYKYSAWDFDRQGVYLLGAPEVLLPPEHSLFAQIQQGWQQGQRVLLLARYDGPLTDTEQDIRLITPLALLFLHNPIRPTAAKTFEYFREQGVTVKVISGDNPLAASRVAQAAQIPGAERYVDAQALDTPEKLAWAAEHYTVFGRVTPEQKKQLLRALKALGHTVAMTGDGVNDVMALKQADCGVAMASGAQAACQVAQLVLVDSDFAAMPQIVAEGRRVINNIQRAAALFLVKNILSLGLALVCLLTGWAYPFQPFHLSIIAALTIGVPGFFLALEPNYQRVEGKFLPTVLRRALPGGLADLLTVALVHFVMQRFGLPLADSATVCTGVLAVVGLAVLYQVCVPFDTFRKLVWGAMAVALLGCFAVLRVPFDLAISDPRSYLVLAVALITAPAIYGVMQRLLRTKTAKNRK